MAALSHAVGSGGSRKGDLPRTTCLTVSILSLTSAPDWFVSIRKRSIYVVLSCIPASAVHIHIAYIICLPNELHLKRYLRPESRGVSIFICVSFLWVYECVQPGSLVSNGRVQQPLNILESLVISQLSSCLLIRLTMYTLHASDLPTAHISRSLGIRGTWFSTVSAGKYRLCTSLYGPSPQTSLLLGA